MPIHLLFIDVPQEICSKTVENDRMKSESAVELSFDLFPDQQMRNIPVTYTWEKIEVGIDVVQGSVFSPRRRRTIRKCILDNGTSRI